MRRGLFAWGSGKRPVWSDHEQKQERYEVFEEEAGA